MMWREAASKSDYMSSKERDESWLPKVGLQRGMMRKPVNRPKTFAFIRAI